MVRISLPGRLKSHNHGCNSNNATSRNPSPSSSNRRSASPDLSRAQGLLLKVVVLKAKNLKASDKNGLSDPYLVLMLGDSKHSTNSVPKTLNPEWNVTIQMPVTSFLFECVCWDKDRFGKDYLGEFDLALEDIFVDDATDQEPRWYGLRSKRPGSKHSNVSGEVLLQFSLLDSINHAATPRQILDKFRALATMDGSETGQQVRTPGGLSPGVETESDDFFDNDNEEERSDGTDDSTMPESVERRRRRLRLKGLRKKKNLRAYEFSGDSDVVGIILLDMQKITDLPPERNMTRTSFDMDPFVIASLGKKTYRTRVIRHNLNPVFNEKMIFQVLRHEQAYSISFTVVDRDKLSGNDFVASAVLPLQEITSKAPEADTETGLYNLKDPDPTAVLPQQNRSRFKLPLSRSASSQSLNKAARPLPSSRVSGSNGTVSGGNSGALTPPFDPNSLPSGNLPSGDSLSLTALADQNEGVDASRSDSDFHSFTIPLKLRHAEKWEEKHSPEFLIKAKYVPYPALRQQFWRAMLKQYDTDESGRISKVELTTMLDTLGSTLKESTIDGFFKRFQHEPRPNEEVNSDLTFDEAVICLEDQLFAKTKQHQTVAERVKGLMPEAATNKVRALMPDSATVKSFVPSMASATSAAASATDAHSSDTHSTTATSTTGPLAFSSPTTSDPDTLVDISQSETQSVPKLNEPGEEGEFLDREDLNDKDAEHVVEIRECPICHQPRLNKRSDADIITHIATCASQDWQKVNSFVMAEFVTSSQAQRKWYSKVITKISYGGYKLGANSANILVQDRITGQINEERMSVYVRLGIRLLYKGLKSRDMEKKRIRKLLKGLSIKQGVKYDDPLSRSEIPKFIAFHQLDMSEVLLPVDQFRNFNQFFYRQLKPNARPCSAPDNPRIIVSPADCRSVVFDRMDEATRIWVKGREFTVERLLGNAYANDANRYTNGALGIFRLAPQDYHRFHIPVDGLMGTPKTIEGEYYTVNPMAIRSALDVYGENVRIIVPIDSVAHGRVMVICVGAMMVGSTVITRKSGEQVKRAEELGYFKFGGSTILLLFEEGAMKFDDDLRDNSLAALETLVRVGMSIGHHPSQSQHTPDMRKKDEDITELEKVDAKRRIEGSGPGIRRKGTIPSTLTNEPAASHAG